MSTVTTESVQTANNPIIISVESRKGGVGKTTAALCLGRVLRKMNYAVLLMDLDITGTNSADFRDSVYWEKDLHAVGESIESGSAVKSPAANLLELFDKTYMGGAGTPAFAATNPHGDNDLTIRFDKINVFGSQIYNLDPMHRGEDGKKIQITCVEKPQELFDDLHSLWLLEFVKGIVEDFIKISSENKRQAAIIIDNSPGYIGFSPVMHEWLTDRGPVNNKFLMVTSLDAQDLVACDLGLGALHELYKAKWQTAKLFHEAESAGSGIEIERDSEAFFYKLAANDGLKDKLLSHYLFEASQQKDDAKKLLGEEYCTAPGKYIAAIVNRVPRFFKYGGVRMALPDTLTAKDREHLICDLIGQKSPLRYSSKRMVLYDEYINYQFALRIVERDVTSNTRRKIDWGHVLDSYSIQIGSIWPNMSGSFMTNEDNLVNLSTQITEVNNILVLMRLTLERNGESRLNRLIQEEWLPSSIMVEVHASLNDLLNEWNLPNYLVQLTGNASAANEKLSISDIHRLRNNLMNRVLRRSKRETISDQSKDTKNLLHALMGIIVLLLPARQLSEKEPETIIEIFAAIFIIQMKHYRKQNGKNAEVKSLTRFLAHDKMFPPEFKEVRMELRNALFDKSSMERQQATFIHFYRACVIAQSRLVDLIADSRFLVQVIMYGIGQNRSSKQAIPYIRGIAESVIIDKTQSHDDAPKSIEGALVNAEYHRDFERVLNKIVTEWGIANG